jgi:hypothetical protein
MGAMRVFLYLFGWLFPLLIVVGIVQRWGSKDEQRERHKRRPF